MSQIEFKNITKEYEDDFKALDDVSFTVYPGEFMFIVGPSGAGKTTLVKLLIREEETSFGEIYLDGENILEFDEERIPELRRRVGVVFQDFKVLPSKNVFENVAVSLEVADVPDYEIREVVSNVLGLVGLSDKITSFPKQLSGGEIQRLAIARALAHEPDILVADEPTGMIDPAAADEVVRILEKIGSLGTTVIMATHNYGIVDRLKKRVVKLDKGKVVSDQKEGKYHE